MVRQAIPAIHGILESIERVQTRMADVTFAEFQARNGSFLPLKIVLDAIAKAVDE